MRVSYRSTFQAVCRAACCAAAAGMLADAASAAVTAPYYNDFFSEGAADDFVISYQPESDPLEVLPVWEIGGDVPAGVFRNRNGVDATTPLNSNNLNSASIEVLDGGVTDTLVSTTFNVRHRSYSGQTTIGLMARASDGDAMLPGETYYYFDIGIRSGAMRIRKVYNDALGASQDYQLINRSFNGGVFSNNAFDIQIDDPSPGDDRPGGDFREFNMSFKVEDILFEGAPAVRLTGTIEAWTPMTDENGSTTNPPAAVLPTQVLDTFEVIDLGYYVNGVGETINTGGVLTGDFFGLRNRGGATGLSGHYVVDYLDFAIEQFGTGTPGLAGDFNGDGVVNAADYTLWRDNLGAPDESSIGNRGDGMNGVDPADYAVWSAAYGSTSATATNAIPEPAALLGSLILVVGSCVSSRRR